MKRYLVTGGSGFTGSAIVKRLSEEGNLVRVFDNGFRGSGINLSSLKNVELYKGDIRSLMMLSKLPKIAIQSYTSHI